MISQPPDSASLYAHLTQGLHAAAQPLTILLASLDRGHTDGMDAQQLRALTASSAIEVQRVCSLFTNLQQLVMAESMPPELSLLPILPLLTQVIEGLHPVFEKSDLRLCLRPPEECPPVLIHRGRTRQALGSVLMVACAIARAGDTIEVNVSSSLDDVQIVVGNANASIDLLPIEMDLGLALAEANMRSQHGSVSVSTRPFRVRIGFQQGSQ